MTRWDALIHMPRERNAEPPRRWWLGWLQLLCAWVVCMLLCANLALVLAKGLPEARSESTAYRQAGCAAAETASQREAKHERQADPAKGHTPRC